MQQVEDSSQNKKASQFENLLVCNNLLVCRVDYRVEPVVSEPDAYV